MKKTIAIILSVLMLLTILASCNTNTDRQSPTKAANPGNNATSASDKEDSNDKENENLPADKENPPENNTEAKSDEKLSGDVFNTFAGGVYHIKTRTVSGGSETITEMYAKNGMTCILMNAGGESMRMITKDNKSYMIYDDQKMYMVNDIPPSTGESKSKDATNTTGLVYVGGGLAEFFGKTHKYDEYRNDNAPGMKFFYFVDNGAFIGTRIIMEDGGVTDTEYLIFDKNVPDSVFEIPSDYTDMIAGLGGFGG